MNLLNEFFKFRKEKLGLEVSPELIDDLNKSNEIFYSNLDKNIDIPLPGITLVVHFYPGDVLKHLNVSRSLNCSTT